MTHEITLYLNDIQHLFNAPNFDLFAAHPRTVSGMDSIFEQTRMLPAHESIKTTIFIPAEQVTPELTERVRLAVQSYVQQKITQAEQELSARRKVGLRSLLYGGTFLGVCLLVALFAQQATFLPSWLSNFLFNGFTIIGWVSLWHPTEALLFDWYPPVHDKRLYAFIQAMEIEIKAA